MKRSTSSSRKKLASVEVLFTCPRCGQAGFTKRGLVAHEAQKRCQKLSMSKPTPKQSSVLVILNDKAITVTESQLPKLKAAAIEQLAAIPRLEREAAARAVLAGLTLHRVKASLPHGQFLPWFKEIPATGGNQKRTTGAYLPTPRMCQYYMRLAVAFLNKSKIQKPEMLALPGDQLNLELASASEIQKEFYQKLEGFVGQSTLNELLDKHGIKERKPLGGARTAGEPGEAATPEQMHDMALEEIADGIERLKRLLIQENRMQYLHACPEEVKGIVISMKELASEVEKAAKPILKK